MNEFIKTQVNYMAIIDALLTNTNQAHAKHNVAMRYKEHGHEIRDFRTVGFTIGRQQGKTEFIRDFCNRYPGDTTVIVKDSLSDTLRKRITQNGESPVISYSTAWSRALGNNLMPLAGTPEDEFNKRYILVDDANHFFEWLGMRRMRAAEFYKAIGHSRGSDVNVILVG